MAHLNVIDVKSCELVYNFDSEDPDHLDMGKWSNTTILFDGCEDLSIKWRCMLDREKVSNTPTIFKWFALIIASNNEWNEDERDPFIQDDENQRGAVVGEASFELENFTLNSKVIKKCGFFYSMKMWCTQSCCEMCKCYLATGQEVNMKLTCKISYTYYDDAIPILISDRFVTVPVEKCELVPAIQKLENLYLSEKHSDVTLRVNGKDYYAHKIILEAHSTVFSAMFKHDMEEKKLNSVEIKDIDESVFLQALRYMYTGKVENADKLVYDFLAVADRYNIEGLKMFCENLLKKQLSLKTVLQILIAADSYNADRLKASAIKFLNDNSKDVAELMNSEDWNAIVARPRLTKDLLCFLMSGTCLDESVKK